MHLPYLVREDDMLCLLELEREGRRLIWWWMRGVEGFVRWGGEMATVAWMRLIVSAVA